MIRTTIQIMLMSLVDILNLSAMKGERNLTIMSIVAVTDMKVAMVVLDNPRSPSMNGVSTEKLASANVSSAIPTKMLTKILSLSIDRSSKEIMLEKISFDLLLGS